MKNTARQQEAMKQQTIGVEVEMNNIRRDAAAKLAADFFGTGRYKNTAADNGYYCWSAWDDKDREWKFQRDVSIAGPDAEKCEMVTPILTYEGRSEERPDKRLRGPHPHRRGRPHTAEPPEPRQHHGKPRGAPFQSPEA